jgi:hypothetical protein
VWAHRIQTERNKRKINSIHGQSCRTITRNYASVSADAAGVLAGLPPLDLEISRINYCLKILKKKNSAPFMDEHISRGDFDSLRHIRQYLEIKTRDIWQAR